MSFLINPFIFGSRAASYATLTGYDSNLQNGYQNATNTPYVTFSIWLDGDLDLSTTASLIISSGNVRFDFVRVTATRFYLDVYGYSSGGSLILQANSANIDVGTGVHLHFYADMSNSSNRGFKVEGIDKTMTWSTYTNANFNWTSTNTIRMGGLPDFTGSVYDCYLDNALVTDNTKFYNGGASVALGSSGETPSGQQPLLFFNGFENWANRGRGGDFTISGGTVTQGAARP